MAVLHSELLRVGLLYAWCGSFVSIYDLLAILPSMYVYISYCLCVLFQLLD